jgi:A/G-specific adenine glycosylase
LHDAAKVVSEQYSGHVPKDVAALRALPGIGEYTASAVRVFAFNEPDVLIETNIRAAFIHHFFENRKRVKDREVSVIAEKALKGNPPAGGPRTWQWALMDYGTHLKKLHGNPSRKSAHYTKQSKFEGSLRQVRGAILRELHGHPRSAKEIAMRCHLMASDERFQKALASLALDDLITKQKGKWRIA